MASRESYSAGHEKAISGREGRDPSHVVHMYIATNLYQFYNDNYNSSFHPNGEYAARSVTCLRELVRRGPYHLTCRVYYRVWSGIRVRKAYTNPGILRNIVVNIVYI